MERKTFLTGSQNILKSYTMMTEVHPRILTMKMVFIIIIIINKYLYRIVPQLYDTYKHIYLHCYARSPAISILEDEVRFALSKMKNNKAPGPDDMPSELISALEEVGIKEVTKLLNTIYDTGEIPTDTKKSIYIAISKQAGTANCDQHRTFSLMGHLTKVLLRILMKRMRNKLLPVISKTQFGFMTDKGTRNAIFALKTLMERSIEVQKDLYLCFIDYSKALDKVRHSDLFDILAGF